MTKRLGMFLGLGFVGVVLLLAGLAWDAVAHANDPSLAGRESSNLTGRVVATAGHVHDGGVRTTLSNQTTGRHLCTSWAGWGKKSAFQGSIESMSGCMWDRVGTVQKGEVLDLETVYNSSKSLPDAMGIMMAFVYETDDLTGGTPAPPDARGETAPPPASTPPPSRHEH